MAKIHLSKVIAPLRDQLTTSNLLTHLVYVLLYIVVLHLKSHFLLIHHYIRCFIIRAWTPFRVYWQFHSCWYFVLYCWHFSCLKSLISITVNKQKHDKTSFYDKNFLSKHTRITHAPKLSLGKNISPDPQFRLTTLPKVNP